MKIKDLFVAFSLGCLAVATSASPTSAFDLTPIGKIGDWSISGTDGHCQARKSIEPGSPSQFAIGIVEKGTFLTLQHLGWRLPSTRTNMMPVSIAFDGSSVVETEALLVGQIRAFQIFIWLTDMSDRVFWERFFAAQSMLVTGDFRPGRVEISLEHASDIVPLMEDCARRYLRNVELPF